MTPAERSLWAKVAANTRWANEPDRSTATAKARDGLLAKFEREVDPDGVLTPDERAKRAKNAMTAHMQRMRAVRARKAAEKNGNSTA